MPKPSGATRCHELRLLAAAFVHKQDPKTLEAMGCGASPAPTANVAILPFDDVRRRLEAHPILKILAGQVDAKKVHRCMTEMLAMAPNRADEGGGDDDDLPRKKVAKTMAKTTSKAVAGTLVKKGTGGVTTSPCCSAASIVDADRSSHVCSQCGRVLAAFFCDEKPHRYFAEDRYEGKVDPNHWVRFDHHDHHHNHNADMDNDHDVYPEIEDLQPHAFLGRATSVQVDAVRQLVVRFASKKSGALHRVAIVAAAWIVTENPRVLTDRRAGMTAEDLPPAPFACRSCSEAFHVRRDLRFHESTCRPSPPPAAGRPTPRAEPRVQTSRAGSHRRGP